MTLSKRNKRHNSSSFGRSRSFSDYHRKYGNKSPGKVVIIVCEGKETEPNYFNALRQKFRLSTLNIKVVLGQGAPMSLVTRAVVEKKKQDADEVWCVLDTENPNENPALVTAITEANRARINLALSNPSFEYWYFIHFEQSSRPFANGQEMKNALKVHIPDYEESANVFSLLDDLTPIALLNAETLREHSPDNWSVFPNPSTAVDKLVQIIIEMGQIKRY